MLKKKITVMLIPRDGRELRQLAIPTKLLWIAGVLVFLFVASNLFFMVNYFSERVDQTRIEKLISENQTLSAQFAQIGHSIVGLEDDYNLLVTKEEAIRSIFDLPAIDPETRMLGIGGPTENRMDSLSPNIASAFRLTADVEGLLRLAKFEKERYQEVFSMLVEKRDRLDHTPSIMPTRGYLSRGFGYKNDPFTGLREFHTGLDIANRTGTQVYATADGRVAVAGLNGGLGKMIELDHGYGMRTRYGHLSGLSVRAGQLVKRGDVIGHMGNTGYSTGPHLHYEVLQNSEPVNPYRFIINR